MFSDSKPRSVFRTVGLFLGAAFGLLACLSQNKDAEILRQESAVCNTPSVKRLLAAGASVESKDESGMTPLLLASVGGCSEVAQLLLDAGADIEQSDDEGRTALIVATQMNRESVVDLLLRRGAKVDAKTQDGWTALLFAAQLGSVPLVKRILDGGAWIDMRNYNGLTALQIAGHFGQAWNPDDPRYVGVQHQPEVAKFLLSRGAKLVD